MKKNLTLWNAVEKTDPSYTKKANVRGNNITSIAPQYQIKQATEQFGVYGDTWGFNSIDFDYSLVDKFNLVVLKGIFKHPNGLFPITASISLYMDRKKTMIDQDFAKKLETDALTKALSKLGFNADIFMGKFDDVKYVQQLEAEKESDQYEKGLITAINKCSNLDQLNKYLEQVNDEWKNVVAKVIDKKVSEFDNKQVKKLEAKPLKEDLTATKLKAIKDETLKAIKEYKSNNAVEVQLNKWLLEEYEKISKCTKVDFSLSIQKNIYTKLELI